MENRLQQVLQGKQGNYIYPFFWMHGEPHDVLLQELEQIYSTGIRGICVESRPHPDFAGEHWWKDMDLVMEYARSHDMKVWLLDDDLFPSGHCNGAFSEGGHELANQFLTVWGTDIKGPQKNGSLLVKSILKEKDELLGVVMYRRLNGETTDLDSAKSVDITKYLKNGWIQYDIPDGLWRILIFYSTHHGNGKKDYFNILNRESVDLLIKNVYEPHYQRYKDDFGTTFEAFFSDEPEFGNLPGYDFQARLGKDMKYIPWSRELQERLSSRWGKRFYYNLGALWFSMGEITNHIRYEYMDEVTKQLKYAYADQIHDWCEAHGVFHTGHIIEDDNSHGRLGCSTGHYFRSLSGMGMGGIDVVLLQIMPGMDQTVHQWVASDKDGEFFHYALGKLGSSFSHVDPLKEGRAMCEIFGAYGWQEGVALMKWLADHMMCRGINHFVPHAFSPKDFPDKDCPPHFYAGGNHAQFKYFKELMGYINRVSHLLSGGIYQAQVAVLYHADAEWAGDAMLLQKPLRILMEHQIEADIISADILYEADVIDGIQIGVQKYEVVVIPYCRYLPEKVGKLIERLTEASIPVIFIDDFPESYCESGQEADIYQVLGKSNCVPLYLLQDEIMKYISCPIRLDCTCKELRTYVYQGDYGLLVYCFHEGTKEEVNLNLKVQEIFLKKKGIYNCNLYQYAGMENKIYALGKKIEGGFWHVPLHLEVGESTIFIFSNRLIEGASEYMREYDKLIYEYKDDVEEVKAENWTLSYQEILGADTLSQCQLSELPNVFCDLTGWAIAHAFNGFLRYESEIELESDTGVIITLMEQSDVCELLIDGICVEKKLSPPYRFYAKVEAGKHNICIELATTPVYAVGDDWSALTVLPPLGLIHKPIICKEVGIL